MIFACVHSHSVLIQVCSSSANVAGRTMEHGLSKSLEHGLTFDPQP